MEFGPYNMLMDFALMSVLLFIAQIMRAKIKLVQNLFLPSSLIAGFLALFLGKQFLKILPFTDNASSYPYMLVVVLFASLFIGNSQKTSFKQTMNKVGDTFIINSAVYFAQYGFALVIGGFILSKFFPEVNQAFAILMPGGFIGGHGAAAAFGGTFKELIGWNEALPIGQTFATIGLLVGVFGGLILINIGTRKKATRFIKTMAELPKSMQTGLVPLEEQTSMGNDTVNPMSMDPLTWHVLLILIASAGGYYFTNWFKTIMPTVGLPMFSVAMIAGVILQSILSLLRLNTFVDKKIITRIGSSCTDYLVAFGVATIKLSIVIKYIVPIVILTLIGVIFGVAYLFLVGRKLFRNFWFERSIFIFGWSTGVIAIGITLLRIVDPQFKSKALEDYGMAYVFMSFIEIALISLLPIIVVNGYGMIAGLVLLAIFIGLIGVARAKYGVHNGSMAELREGEAEIIDEYNRMK
jgi:ESS family glutamate:Na+ symporter